MKRLFDLIASGCGLLVLCPLFIILAVLIKLDSKGPIFYKQNRVGRYNKDFALLKFRSMRVGSDNKMLITVGSHDPRVTHLGFFIRKFKLDEFPQLLNVLKGDMSIVGPRPEVRCYVDLYTPTQMNVLDVRPGITDMASIKYRNENDLLEKAENPEKYYFEVIMQDKLRINLEYVTKHSFCVDLKIIISTFKAIISE